MKKSLIATTLLATLTVGCTDKAVIENTDTKIDTGVGENGVALPSNTSFSSTDGVKVDMANLVQAETAKYFAEEIALSGGNKFRHERNGIQLDAQTVIRSNFDAIYSYGVFDASEGLTVEIPEHDLYHSVQVFDENHVTIGVVKSGEKLEISKDQLTKGNHVYLFMRTQPRTYNEEGMIEVRQRQDSVVVKNPSQTVYESSVKYDVESFNKLRMEIIRRAPHEVIIHKGFISDIADIVEPHYQMANTAGWAGLPANHAFYFVVMPSDEASKSGQCSSTTFNAPELQYEHSGYWSLTVYDAQGWVATDKYNVNSETAIANKDGSYTIHFNCGDDAVNNLKVTEGWNGLFRNYLPTSVENIINYQKDFNKNSQVKAK